MRLYSKGTAVEISGGGSTISKSIVLMADGWEGNTQTVEVSGILADETKQLIQPIPLEASQDQYFQNGITAKQGNGKITFTALRTPSENIELLIAITNFNGEDEDGDGSISLTLNNNSWDVISEVSIAGQGELYWEVGDCKAIEVNGDVGDYLTLSGTKYVYIIDFNHVDGGVEDNNIMWATFMSELKGGVPMLFVDSKYRGGQYKSGEKTFTMNHWGNTNYGGWAGCDLRYDILGATNVQPKDYGKEHTTSNVGYDADKTEFKTPKAKTLLASFPPNLRTVMRYRDHWADSKGNQSKIESNVTKITDAISLLMEFEFFGEATLANPYEQYKQTQFAYWANANSKEMIPDGTESINNPEFCFGSPALNRTTSFCSYNGGEPNDMFAHSSGGIVACFKT